MRIASLLLVLTLTGLIGYNPPKQSTVEIKNRAVVSMGLESFAHIELIEQIKQDLKITDRPVKVLIGSYEREGVLGELITLPEGYFVIIEQYFYRSLTHDEKVALIAHEMGHVLYRPRIHVYDLNRTSGDIASDFYAVKWAEVDPVISLLDKLYFWEYAKYQPDYKIRRAALEEVKRN